MRARPRRSAKGRRDQARFLAIVWIASLGPLVVPSPAHATSGDISSYAGGPGRGPALNVSQTPSAVAVLGANVYVADESVGVIRRIDTTTGIEHVMSGDWTVPEMQSGNCGSTGLTSAPDGLAVAVDASGNVYFSVILDFWGQVSQVCRLAPDGSAAAVAGGGTKTANNIPATQALVRRISAIAVDSLGNLYIAENQFDLDTAATIMSRVRRVDPGGVIRAFAGTGTVGSSGDGKAAVNARLNTPGGLAPDNKGAVYIADTGNNRVRKVAAGIITNVAGTGVRADLGDGFKATLAALNAPVGVAVGPGSNLFIADTGNHRVRKVSTSDGVISAYAGNGQIGYSGDGGLATAARLVDPVALAVTTGGRAYIADHTGARIRMVYQGIIQTKAGNGQVRHTGDGGLAVDATFYGPQQLSIVGSGLLVADTSYIRRIDLGTGIISTIAGNGSVDDSGDGGPAKAAGLHEVTAIAPGPGGNLFLVGTAAIRRIDATGKIHHVAGDETCCGSEDNVPAATTSVTPTGIAVDGAGNLWFNDTGYGGLRMIDTAGIIHNIPGTIYSFGPTVIDSQGRVLYGAYYDLKRYDPVAHTVTVIAGTGQAGSGGDGGPATQATLNFISAMALGSDGSVYLADLANETVHRIDPGGIIHRIAGQTGLGGFGGDGGPATTALLDAPVGVEVDGSGNVYITDRDNGRIRRITG